MPDPAPTEPLLVHATCVSWSGRAVLLTGPSHSGKSALGLQLLAFGCDLVADDQTLLEKRDGVLWASCPVPIKGLIEARGVGLLNVDAVSAARPVLAVALDVLETERLPPERHVTYLGTPLPLLHNIASGHFAAAILQYLKAGRRSA